MTNADGRGPMGRESLTRPAASLKGANMRKRPEVRYNFAPLAPTEIPPELGRESEGEADAEPERPLLTPETAQEVLKIAFDRLLAPSGSTRHPASDRGLWPLVGATALGFDPHGLRTQPDPRWARAAKQQLERYWRALDSPKHLTQSEWLTARLFFEGHRAHAADLAKWLRKKCVSLPVKPKEATLLRIAFDRKFLPTGRCDCLAKLFPRVLAELGTNRADSEVAALAIAKYFGIAKGKLTQLSH